MFCPGCLTPNAPDQKECEQCRGDLAGLRQRVSVGAQFVFADASPRRPVALSLDGGEPQVFTQPTLLSRHLHGIGFGDYGVPPSGTWWELLIRRRHEPSRPTADLPRLPAPAGPDLTAVITERKIYRPRDEVRIFIVAPDAPGGQVEMEVQLAGQQITRQRVTLDGAGLALHPYAGLEEGEYTVLVRRPGREGSRPAQCTFSVAEFSLSPLIALLERHIYETGQLSFHLKVLALSVPYDGPVELALQSGERVVDTQKARVRQGSVQATFDVQAHEGPFRVQVTTPGGDTAAVFFPGTARTDRERITLCPLGQVAEAGLLPGDDTVEVRGLHIGYDGLELTPLRLEQAVARTGKLVAEVRAAVVQVVAFHSLTGESTLHEWRDVGAGDVLEFPVEAPYTLFTTGMLAPRQPYEAWGVVVHPSDLEARLSAPASAGPGDDIPVRIETGPVRLEAGSPATCLLLVYDARLEHESPIPKLGKQLLDAIRAGTQHFEEQVAPTLTVMSPSTLEPTPLEDLRVRSLPDPDLPVRRSSVVLSELGSEALSKGRILSRGSLYEAARHLMLSEGLPVATEVEPLAFVAVSSREDFPELAYMELFPVDGVVERIVPLGDQIGTWRCRAYLVSGLDVLELTADVEAAKAVYAELDLPAIIGQGDDILASVRYHTRQPATMTITLPGGETISGAVMGHGAETFHLTAPGEVIVHIFGQEGEDWTTRTVPPPGVQTVTASRLEILKKGETVRAERVVVYPGPADVLKDTIEALGRYPFG